MKIPFIFARIANWLLVLIILAGIILSQLYYDNWKTALGKNPDIPYNIMIEPHPLPSAVLKKTSFGLDNLIADIMWLQTIQYYGGGLPNERYRELPIMIETVTDLDKKFAYPYSFGLLMLPGEGFVKDAIKLGDKGLKIKEMRDNWEIPYYLAMIYRFNLHDNKMAAKYFEMASKIDGAPEMAAIMAGINYEKVNQRLLAYKLYEGIYQKAKNKQVRKRAKEYMDHIVLMEELETAAKIYKQKFGNFPQNLGDLEKAKIIDKIPPDPIGRGLAINPTTGTIIELQK
ncbi:MAG: hypothetical protein Q7S37_00210 [bacterium]|nr:hypothetical protein [bacterium]